MKEHWPEYAMEAFGLGLFMFSACTFGVLLEHPSSPAYRAMPDPAIRRVLFGAAMALTAIANVYSPWGKQSGAHFNPCVTLSFFRLGKVKKWDLVFYTLFQFAGGALGVMVARVVYQPLLGHPDVNYVATLPGPNGILVAFVAEVAISFIMMSVILRVSNRMSIAHLTGLFAGGLVLAYISLEAPLSGMSMNPARTLASAVQAHSWMSLWIYFTAPPLGMLGAAELYLGLNGRQNVFCAKLHHQNSKRCIFCDGSKTTSSHP
jgi:aquaporin Z